MQPGSLPRDVAKAIGHLRANLDRSVPTAELARQAGVAKRTLLEHFQAFIAISPGRYGTRLRLAAVRQALQQRSNRESVTSIAVRHGFSHLGRFAGQYRRAYGEPPSATRRNATATSSPAGNALASPAPRSERLELVIIPFAAPPLLASAASLVGEGIAAAICGDTAVSVLPQRAPERWRDIDARYVLRGRVVEAGERLRVVAALVDAAGGRHLWGDAWDGRASDAFAIVDRAVAGAARAIPSAIRKAEIARVAQLATESLEAHELCLRAYSLLAANTAANARQALDFLYRAIERDPDYGLAAALAAWAHAQRVSQMSSTAPAEDRARALALSERAALLDPDHAMVLTARSIVHRMAGEGDLAQGLIARALARNPHLAWTWERSGWLKAYAGDMTGATHCFGRALRLDPAISVKATLFAGISAACFARGRYDHAARWMRRALEVEPGACYINRTLAVAYARLGERGAAMQSLAALRRYRPDITVRDVAAALPLPPDFVSRVANGLNDLGLPP
jgi:AraC-like DNA-binding protein/tetratricopeptide (TPR) repeat protein